MKPLLAIATVIFVVSMVTARAVPTVAAGQRDPVAAGPESWTGDLTPIAATDWNYARAAHLVERAGFGAAPEEVRRLAAMSPRQAVDELVDYEAIRNDLKSFD